MAINIDVGVKSDTRDLKNFGAALDDVADKGESMGEQIERSMTEAERRARPTNSEYKRLASDLERYARRSGQSMSDAFADFERHAHDAGLEVSEGTMDALRRLGDRAPSDVDKVSAAFREMSASAKAEGDDMASALEQDSKRIKDSFEGNQIEAEDIFRESLRAELVSNMGETGAEVVRGFKDGFDSEDLSTIVDGVTDTMVSIGQLGGPAGTAAGLAGGALVQAFAGPYLEEAERSAEQFEEIYASAFDAIVEHGADAGRELAIQNASNAIVEDTERLAEAQDIAAASGADYAVVIRAMAGDTDALALVQETAADREAELREQRDRARESADRSSDSLVNLSEKERETLAASGDLSRGMETLTDRHGNATGAINDATEAAQAKADVDAYATEKALENATAQAKQTDEAQELTVKLDGVSQAIKVMPNGKVVKVTDDGTAKLTQKEIDQIEGKRVRVGVDVDATNFESYIQGLSYRRPVLNVDVRHRRVGGPTP